MSSPARALGAGAAAAAAVGLAAFAWGSLVERNRFTVRREVVPVLDEGARTLTVLHLSDFHMAPWQREKQAWIARTVELAEPDLVLATGDLLGHRDGVVGVREALAPLLGSGVPGAFVHGSNDYFGPGFRNPFRYFGGPKDSTRGAEVLDVATLEYLLADELGWFDLNGDAATTTIRGSRVDLVGVDDPHLHYDRVDVALRRLAEVRDARDVADAVSAATLDATGGVGGVVGIPGGSGPAVAPRAATTVALAHAPYRRVLDAFADDAAADLIVAGHTHGGQVRVPGLPALVTNCDVPREQAQGLTRWRGAWLEVSAGLGTSIYAPVRFACPPEAVLLELVPRG